MSLKVLECSLIFAFPVNNISDATKGRIFPGHACHGLYSSAHWEAVGQFHVCFPVRNIL